MPHTSASHQESGMTKREAAKDERRNREKKIEVLRETASHEFPTYETLEEPPAESPHGEHRVDTARMGRSTRNAGSGGIPVSATAIPGTPGKPEVEVPATPAKPEQPEPEMPGKPGRPGPEVPHQPGRTGPEIIVPPEPGREPPHYPQVPPPEREVPPDVQATPRCALSHSAI